MKLRLLVTGIVALLSLGIALSVNLSPKTPRKTTADINAMRIAWLLQMRDIENQYTERTYQCIMEMYSLAYEPVSSGPVCRESCKLLEQVNSLAQSAPAYIVNPRQYELGDSKVCPNKLSPKKQIHKEGTVGKR